MSWFPSTIQNLTTWRFQVVPILILFSEAATRQHMQIMTGSRLCLLPRIISGSQSLISNRPASLVGIPAMVIGVSSGIKISTLNYFANIIHPIDNLPPFSFWVYTIEFAEQRIKRSLRQTISDIELDALDYPEGNQSDQQNRRLRWRPTLDHRLEYGHKKIPTQTWSSMQILTIISGLMSIGILILSIVIKDGVGCLTVSLLSLTATVAGYGSLWSPQLRRLSYARHAPAGDVVIRTRSGAFIVVHCNEAVSRSLYTGTEDCIYSCDQRSLKILRLGSTYLFLASLVLLSNCKWQTQLAFGCAWILSAVMSWAIAFFPLRHFWNLSSVYNVVPLYPVQSGNAHMPKPELRPTEVLPSYTRTLWYAIRETRSIEWVLPSGAVHYTPEWRYWLQQALEHVDDIDWPAHAEKERIVDNREDMYDFPLVEEPQDEGRGRTSMDIEVMPQPVSEW